MATRREFLNYTFAATALTGVGLQVGCAKKESPALPPASTSEPPRMQSLIRRDETIVRYPVHGDNWHMSWAADDKQYISLCDGLGAGHSGQHYNSRLLAMSGVPQSATFEDVSGYPLLNPQFGKDPRYYNFGTLALDGKIYQFMSTFIGPSPKKEDPNFQLRFIGAKLIYSPDNGRTWHNQDGTTPVRWESWNERSRQTLVFYEEPQETFSMPTLLQMGRNYELNTDGHLYVYSPNGNTEGTMNQLVLFRVPKAELLSRDAYEYFAGLNADGSARWSKDIAARTPTYTFPSGWVGKKGHPYSWIAGVTYNGPLKTYMMTSWGTGHDGPDGMWFKKPSYLGFWTAPNPWGPWKQVHEETAWTPGNDPKAGCYTPLIAPKWIAEDGKSFWLVWTDFQQNEAECKKMEGLKGGKLAEQQRKCMPYYAFNAQRVDVVVA